MSPAGQQGFNLAVPADACAILHSASSYLRAHISRAEDVVDLSWYEECFELRWNVCGSVRDVKITNAED